VTPAASPATIPTGRADSARPWVEAVLDDAPPAPVVLVLGGFLTSPPIYRAFDRSLRDRGAADVVVGNVWTMDWLLAATRGLGPIVTRSGRALLEASRRSEAVSGGAPVLLIGHSAGGMSARLLTSSVPFRGRRLNASGRIGAIVTLGTPHAVPADVGMRGRSAVEAATFASREVPGAMFQPTTAYLSIASRRVVGREHGTPGERRTWALYRAITPEPPTAAIEGDGLVPVAAALLPGASQLVLDDAAHGQGLGRDWYGSERSLDRWWPLALEAWHAALRARAAPGSIEGAGFRL
jgi:hypothetical protein